MSTIVVQPAIPLKPCPFCKSDDLHIETDSVPGFAFTVMCDNPECQAVGPIAQTADEASQKWNAAT